MRSGHRVRCAWRAGAGAGGDPAAAAAGDRAHLGSPEGRMPTELDVELFRVFLLVDALASLEPGRSFLGVERSGVQVL